MLLWTSFLAVAFAFITEALWHISKGEHAPNLGRRMFYFIAGVSAIPALAVHFFWFTMGVAMGAVDGFGNAMLILWTDPDSAPLIWASYFLFALGLTVACVANYSGRSAEDKPDPNT